MIFETIFNLLGVLLVLWTIYVWLNNWIGRYRVVCTWTGWVIGGLFGASTGIATGGTAFEGTYIFSPLAAWIGFLLAPSIDKHTRWLSRTTVRAESQNNNGSQNSSEGAVASLLQQERFKRLWLLVLENAVPGFFVLTGIILLWVILGYS